MARDCEQPNDEALGHAYVLQSKLYIGASAVGNSLCSTSYFCTIKGRGMTDRTCHRFPSPRGNAASWKPWERSQVVPPKRNLLGCLLLKPSGVFCSESKAS